MGALEQRLIAEAHRLGFDLAGIAAAAPADGFERLRDWLGRGFAGEMAYMHEHAEARRHPVSIYPPVRSVVMVAMTYSPSQMEAKGVAFPARVARYAQGPDYH